MKIFLDMDGVIADFVMGVHDAVHLGYAHHKYPYEFGKWDMFEQIRMRTNGQIEKARLYGITSTYNFWATLPWMPDGQKILKTVIDCVGKKDLYVCTAPMNSPDCWSGKIEWLKTQAGIHKNTIVMSASKSLLAKPDCLLIDDKDENVDAFVAAGGKAYLVPRPWNRDHARRADVAAELKSILTGV